MASLEPRYHSHLNPCLFCEFLEQVWIDIISPVVDDQLVTILGIHAHFDLVLIPQA